MAKKKISKKELALRLALLSGHIGECLCTAVLGDFILSLCSTCLELVCDGVYCNLDRGYSPWKRGIKLPELCRLPQKP